MGYVGIDTAGARRIAQAMADASTQADQVRQQAAGALALADLDSPAPGQLGTLADGLSTVASQVKDRADLADRFTADPTGVAKSLDAPVDQVATALTDLIGFGGPADLRSVLTGLPAPGVDASLDAALRRLSPVLLPAFLAGQRPVLDGGQLADLRVLADALGIRSAGPPAGATHTGTEVFWNDFWADGRTVAGVLADPAELLDWVAGTFELDRRLALATELPGLADVLSTVDFATGGGDVDAAVAEVAANFAAIDGWLPAFLAGTDRTPPDATQRDQTLAFATRLGWTDPGATVPPEQRFASAVAYLRANRVLGGALLPTGFAGDPQPLAFFDATGIGQLLDLGRRVGVVTGDTLTGLESLATQLGATLGGDNLPSVVGALLASQVPQSFLQTPGLGPRFEAALTYIQGATTDAELRQRIAEAIAAFRTLAITGPPALTERQLIAVVGPRLADTVGRSGLRLRGSDAVARHPEFLLVTQEWGVPGSHSQKLGKYKFSWSFDDTGALVSVRRKKRSWFARAADTVKAIIHSIGDAFEDNIFQAIVQVGKIALGALAFIFPGTQLLGAAALALNVGDAITKAASGDLLGALSAGLSVFTAGASDVFALGLPTAVDLLQQQVVDGIFGGLGDATVLDLLKDAKRVVDIGSAVAKAIDTNSIAAAIGATLTAGAFAVGSGGQLLKDAGDIGKDLTDNLVRLGKSLGDLATVVVPGAGLVTALETGDAAGIFTNGLGVISAGAKTLSNTKGAFSFDPDTRASLLALAQGTGATSMVTRAILAADQGQAATAVSFLAQAVEAVNDPNKTVTGNRAQIVQRIADIGTVIESITDSGHNPTPVAPQAAALILQRLQLLVNAASTPPNPNAG